MEQPGSPTDSLESEDREPLSGESNDGSDAVAGGNQPRVERQNRRKSRSGDRFALVLFFATFVSTFFARGSRHIHEGLWTVAVQGLSYSIAVMLILVAHEMGHYLQARRHGVRASLPYFIPLPPFAPTGTLGALIVQQSDDADRKQLLDIALTGPLLGLAVALPITYIGLLYSTIEPIPENYKGIVFGEPLVIQWMIESIHGEIPTGSALNPTPFAFAGWAAIVLTGLALIPVSVFDGGHILYALIGKPAHIVARVFLCTAVAYMVWVHNILYLVLGVLLIAFAPQHPPTRDDNVMLGPFRILLGWLTLAFVIFAFTLNPIVQLPI